MILGYPIRPPDNLKPLDAIDIPPRCRVHTHAHNLPTGLHGERYAEPKPWVETHQPNLMRNNVDQRHSPRQGGGHHMGLHVSGVHDRRGRTAACTSSSTASPTKDIVADTRANIEYVKKTFRMPA